MKGTTQVRSLLNAQSVALDLLEEEILPNIWQESIKSLDPMAEKPAGEKVKQGQESENDANSLPNFRSFGAYIMLLCITGVIIKHI